MSDLNRWNPFKFRRKNAEEKHGESKTEAPASALVPAGLPPMARLFDSFFRDSFFRDPFFTKGSELDRWFGDFSAAKFSPTVDVVDEESHLKISAELPGMTKDDVHLSIDNNVLTIRGEKKHEEEKKEAGCYRVERSYGMFSRSLPLPVDIDPDKAEATFEKGVLTLRVPKAPKKEPAGKKIEIKG